MGECPCGLGFTYTDCCGPMIRGVGAADTAEDLLRSRYTAYTKKNWDYLIQTTHSTERPEREDFARWGDAVRWKRLEIVGSRKGGREDSEGEVSFVAYYSEGGEDKTLQESSKFRKENGRWYYCAKESRTPSPKSRSSKPFTRSHEKVGRNDPCSCGSGKKFKKCCGK